MKFNNRPPVQVLPSSNRAALDSTNQIRVSQEANIGMSHSSIRRAFRDSAILKLSSISASDLSKLKDQVGSVSPDHANFNQSSAAIGPSGGSQRQSISSSALSNSASSSTTKNVRTHSPRMSSSKPSGRVPSPSTMPSSTGTRRHTGLAAHKDLANAEKLNEWSYGQSGWMGWSKWNGWKPRPNPKDVFRSDVGTSDDVPKLREPKVGQYDDERFGDQSQTNGRDNTPSNSDNTNGMSSSPQY